VLEAAPRFAKQQSEYASLIMADKVPSQCETTRYSGGQKLMHKMLMP
jgi:hypothetical protein